MEFTIPVESLQNVVKKMNYVLKIATDDVTSMMMIDASGEHVKFYGTGGSVYSVITARDCEVTKKGKILMQLRDISTYIVKFMPLSDGFGTANFKINTDDKEGTLKTKTIFPSGKPAYRSLKFKTFDPVLLPAIKEFEDAQLIVNSDILFDGLSKILHCVDPSEIREAISGVYLRIDKDKIVFTGTNGIKLSEANLDIVADIKESIYVIKYSMAIAMKMILDHDAQVFMKFEGRDIYIRCNDVYLSGGLVLNDPYPDYKATLQAYDKIVSVPRYDLIDSISAANSVLNAEDNNRLTMQFNGNELTLKNDRIEAVHKFDEEFAYDLDIDINGAFLLSMISDFIGEYLEICFIDNAKPVIFRAKDNEDHTSLLMLLRRR